MTEGPSSNRRGSSIPPLELLGIAGSPGFAIGPSVVVRARRSGVVYRRVAKHMADSEMERFDEAVKRASDELKQVADKMQTGALAAESSILQAYVLMVEDSMLRDDVERRIRIDRQCAEWALDSAAREMASQLAESNDPYLAERSHDFGFVSDRILRALTGKRRGGALAQGNEPGIIVAHDLSPAETAALTKETALALVTEVGTRTSHTAILARALEIPAVVGVGELLKYVGQGDVLVVDGLHGRVTICPSEPMLADARARASRYRQVARQLLSARDRPAQTKCGTPIELRANIELPAEAQIALSHGARGIGLYRTEFLYVNRSDPPGEDEQYEIYKQVITSVLPCPVTIRTFDIGGDKFVSSFRVPEEMNPALGLRAVRLGLKRPELFLAQLRAIVRASAHGPVRIMVPMVAVLKELREVRALLGRAIEQVDQAGQKRASSIPLGVMIEVPSAAILADRFAGEAEFMSIGTNDLVQYALAVDRGSQMLARLGSSFDPAILRLIHGVVIAGELNKRPVVVCGAMASDPLAAILLVGMGLRELSLEASAIPEVKEAIGRFTLEEAEISVRETMEALTAEEVEQRLAERFAPRIADLLDPGD